MRAVSFSLFFFVARWHGKTTSYGAGCQKRLAAAYTPPITKKSAFLFEEHFQIVLIVTGKERSLELESFCGLTGGLRLPLAQGFFGFCG